MICEQNSEEWWVVCLARAVSAMRHPPQAALQTNPAYKAHTCAEASDLSDAWAPDPGSSSLGNLLLSR